MLTVAWCDATFVRPEAVASLPAPALNARCLDISKSTVDRIWRQVSGRGLSLDPLTSVGPILVKSEENGKHDGRIISGPIPQRLRGFVYQLLVDNRVRDHFVDLRAVILDCRVVLTHEVRRDIDNRFGGSYDPVNPMASTRIAGPDAFSVEESDALLDFAARIGLDYGELDVLRDADGTTYVVDANKTPVFPRRSLREPEATVAVKRMADAFQELISRHRGAFE